ncbi:Ger(x)C family germination protein [Aneurinibacillus soli]|uniref:Spore germination protein B3 n=1 Tax=Aneurinibacillus soli TaxID=1500254 RepID=A0A0U5BG82_9BACL|nr:Ger(x)C family spore germination protein [Aneurinibacillus soli]PYE61877.1 Ger(x)C family germination protein [Aneurinibacillus soli]BAU29693.1 Spore germination protein B3 precursor [Aneurinibacillus soli]
MMLKQIMVTLLIPLLLLLPGCWDGNEPERMVYLHGMGVDYKNGHYIVYLQIINVGKLAKSESGGGGEPAQVEIGHASGESIDQAIFNLYKSTQRRVFWGHLSFVVMTEAALKQGINPVIDLMDRYRETRYRIWMFGTKGSGKHTSSLRDILLSLPMIEFSTALNKVSEPYNNYNQSSFIRPINMRELIMQLDEPGHDAIIPTVSMTKNTWESNDKPRSAIKVDGVTIITPKQFKGFLHGNETAGMRWMTKKSKRNELIIKKNGKSIAGLVIEKTNVHIHPRISGKTVQFDIKIKTKATINEFDQNNDIDFLQKQASQIIEKEVQHTYQKALELHADVYQLSETLYKREIKTWKQIEKNGAIPLSNDSITVHAEVFITDSGKQLPLQTIE